MIISIIIIAFSNLIKQNKPPASYAPNLLFNEIVKSKCEQKNISKILFGMKLHQSYKIEYNTNLKREVMVQYWSLDEKLYLKRKCYL